MRGTRNGLRVVAALCSVALAGCAGSDGAGSDGARLRDAGFAEVLALPAATADHAWYPESVTAALPSVRYVEAGEAHACELTAVGRFTDWVASEPDEVGQAMIDLTFAVDEVVDALGDPPLEGRSVTVHVGVDGAADVERVADELVALGDVVLFLTHVGPEPWPPPEWVVVFDDMFLGDVHDDGSVTWPVVDAVAAAGPGDARPRLDVSTLDELRAAAPSSLVVDVSG
ncbi:hypothetical protein ACFQHV_01695 [Promicromonospora thailandica]|uniref:Uncharacterized protein n=1 Tax=Promicromonospora thailandica TaxID=765201 RepID=A0A9X2G937_9MICO|nr:hypothetical protein [Promicromonospora thailandica]MCP2265434.1 hypothetical protein [Promicromonospora thailandica]